MSSPHFEVGYVARARGLDGQVIVRTFDPQSQALAEVDRALLRLKDGQLRELVIEHSSPVPRGWLVRFKGIAEREWADELIGARVLVFRADLTPPAEGEYFQGDLIGLEVVDEKGAPLGTVEEVWNTGPVPTLVIRGADRVELLAPFADDFVREVDVERRRLVLRPPELLE